MMPSNAIAQTILDTEGKGHKVFPNLARGGEVGRDVVAEVTAIAKAELEAAGIEVTILPAARGEVPSMAFGSLHMWSFERRWYYWSASGPGIPLDIAEELHGQFGREVRVDGNCTAPSPREWFHGFAVGSYHVDTQEGLNALAAALRKVALPIQKV